MKVRITPGALLLLPVMAAEQKLLFLATAMAAVFHECGHLLAARILKIQLRMLEIDVMGAKIYPRTPLPSYKAEILLAGAGPLFSLLLALPAALVGGAFFEGLLTATLSFALFNLLPIRGFDGGRMLEGALAGGHSRQTAERALFLSTYLSLLLLFSLSACMLLRHGESGTLAFLTASLFARLFLSFDHLNKK